jgi:hypothetical protein
MTLPLALTVPLMADEPTTYFAARLAARNFQDGHKLGLDMGFRFEALERGCERTISHLSDISGANFTRLMRNSPKTVGVNFDFGGQTINQKSRRGSHFVCPACLEADIARGDLEPAVAIRARIQWTLTAIGTCVDHGIALVAVADERNRYERHDWTKLVAPILKDLPKLTDRAIRRPASKLDTYLVDRVKSGAGGYWLDRLSFFAAEQTAHLFGSAALYGNSTVRDLTDDQKYAAGDAGFEITKDGASGIADFLSNMHSEFVSKDKKFFLRHVYGRIYSRLSILSKDPAFHEVRDIVADHAPSKFPLGPGDAIFGKPITARRLHSVPTLAKQFMCSLKRVENILSAAGVSLDEQPNGQEALFNVNEVELALESALQTVSLKEAETIIGASPNIMRVVLAKGFVKRHRMDRTYHGLRFQNDELSSFLTSVMEGAEPVVQPTSEMSSLSYASAKTRCKITSIIQMIVDKKLRWVGRHVSAAGLASLLVYAEDVTSALALERAPPEGMSAPDASRKLGIPVAIFRELAARNIVAGREVREPLSGRIWLRFSVSELDRFSFEYVSLYKLSKGLGRKSTRVRRELEAQGVMPAPGMDGLSSIFYRRADVETSR